MATDTATRDTMGIARGVCGTSTGDGTALVVSLGFKPKMVVVYNQTDAVKWEKIDGMVDANSIKTVTAGTQTTDTTSAIVLSDTGFTLSAAANASAKSLAWAAF